MGNIQKVIDELNYLLSDKNKKHIIGGILISISLFFAGLAVTSLTLNY